MHIPACRENEAGRRVEPQGLATLRPPPTLAEVATLGRKAALPQRRRHRLWWGRCYPQGVMVSVLLLVARGHLVCRQGQQAKGCQEPPEVTGGARSETRFQQPKVRLSC